MNNDKCIIVTGGSSGIGESIACKLLKQGYRVWICGRNEAVLKKKKQELSLLGRVDYLVLDLADRKQIFSFCRNWKKKIYALINNAGICQIERLEEEKDIWDEVLNVNLYGPYFLTKKILPFIQDGGRVINISSQLGKEGRAGYSAYCSSKFALIGLTKCWAKELGERKITVNAICPGWVKTKMAMTDLKRLSKEKGLKTKSFYREICQPLELKRFTEPGEVANLVSFLVSEEGSGVTGRDWLMNTIWNQE